MCVAHDPITRFDSRISYATRAGGCYPLPMGPATVSLPERILYLLASIAVADRKVGPEEFEALTFIAKHVLEDLGHAAVRITPEDLVRQAIARVEGDENPVASSTRVASSMLREQRIYALRLCISMVMHDGVVGDDEVARLSEIASGLAITDREFESVVEAATR